MQLNELEWAYVLICFWICYSLTYLQIYA